MGQKTLVLWVVENTQKCMSCVSKFWQNIPNQDHYKAWESVFYECKKISMDSLKIRESLNYIFWVQVLFCKQSVLNYKLYRVSQQNPWPFSLFAQLRDTIFKLYNSKSRSNFFNCIKKSHIFRQFFLSCIKKFCLKVVLDHFFVLNHLRSTKGCVWVCVCIQCEAIHSPFTTEIHIWTTMRMLQWFFLQAIECNVCVSCIFFLSFDFSRLKNCVQSFGGFGWRKKVQLVIDAWHI